MKRFFQKLYEHIEITLLVCLSISFITGIYIMMNKVGGRATMNYVAQAIIGAIIIGNIIFWVNDKQKKIG